MLLTYAASQFSISCNCIAFISCISSNYTYFLLCYINIGNKIWDHKWNWNEYLIRVFAGRSKWRSASIITLRFEFYSSLLRLSEPDLITKWPLQQGRTEGVLLNWWRKFGSTSTIFDIWITLQSGPTKSEGSSNKTCYFDILRKMLFFTKDDLIFITL